MSEPRTKNVTVYGTEYTLQHPGAYWYIDCADRHKDSERGLQLAPYMKELLENVVVQPKVSFEEDFKYDAVTPTVLVEKIENFLNSRQDQSGEDKKEG